MSTLSSFIIFNIMVFQSQSCFVRTILTRLTISTRSILLNLYLDKFPVTSRCHVAWTASKASFGWPYRNNSVPFILAFIFLARKFACELRAAPRRLSSHFHYDKDLSSCEDMAYSIITSHEQHNTRPLYFTVPAAWNISTLWNHFTLASSNSRPSGFSLHRRFSIRLSPIRSGLNARNGNSFETRSVRRMACRIVQPNMKIESLLDLLSTRYPGHVRVTVR